ncbi:MAG: hypothetical protein ACLQBX_03645 [Candidatus Limnocylindrales bacterium]
MSEPTPLLYLPGRYPLFRGYVDRADGRFVPDPRPRLRHPRYFQISQWLLVEYRDIGVGDREDYGAMVAAGLRPRVLTGDPLPPPFDFVVDTGGGAEPLT